MANRKFQIPLHKSKKKQEQKKERNEENYLM